MDYCVQDLPRPKMCGPFIRRVVYSIVDAAMHVSIPPPPSLYQFVATVRTAFR